MQAYLVPGFYEYELSLGLGKSTVLLVYNVLHIVQHVVDQQYGGFVVNGFLLVLMSWCMMNNLMLGSAGIVWEAVGLWLAGRSPRRGRSGVPWPCHSGCVDWKVPSPAMTMIMSTVLFPFWDPGLISSRTHL